ncbi:MAG: hypothetical protein NBV63_02835 [Candidatus Pacebacteria bacterium]|nr:hypothetical protein [Candidatus Paceibacterota bacterium]
MNLLLLLPILSVFILPWWVTVPLAILAIMLPYGWVSALSTGLLLDTTYGTPLYILGGSTHLYSLAILGAVLAIALLSDRVMDYDA